MSRRLFAVFAALLVFVLAPPVGAAVVPATDLAIPSAMHSSAKAINSSGHIVVDYLLPYLPNPMVSVSAASVFLPPHPGGISIDLGCTPDCTPGSGSEFHTVNDIASDGRTVGSLAFPASGSTAYLAATWSPTGSETQLYVESYEISIDTPIAVEGINSSGMFVGTRLALHNFFLLVIFPTLWQDSQAAPENLPNDGPSLGPYPKSINDAEIIVGHSDGATPYAAVWIPNGGYQLSSLPLLPSGSLARARDINNSGLIVGMADDGTGFDTAVFWQPLGGGTYLAAALPRLAAGHDCEATAVNNLGQAVGRCTDALGAQRGIVWTLVPPAILHELEPLPGETELSVNDVNDQGVAVGASTTSVNGTAVFWDYTPELEAPALSSWGGLLLVTALVWTSVRKAAPNRTSES